MMRKATKITLLFIAGCLLIWIPYSCFLPQSSAVLGFRIQKMSGFPQEEAGISLGVSACYAGIVNDELLLAGGCNFPGAPVAEGGIKRFYKGIYAASLTADSLLAWRKIGEMPVPAAYGVTLSTPGGLILVGGTNENGPLSSVYRLSLSADNQSVTIDTLRSLPVTMDNMAGTVIGDTLYVVGGNVNGKPSNAFYTLCYTESDAVWTAGPSFPGEPRVQPVCTAQAKDGKIYLWGGFAPFAGEDPASVSTNGYGYSLAGHTWTPLSNPVGNNFAPVFLGGGSAFTLNDSLIICTGGVNEKIFLAGLQREEMLKRDLAVNRLDRVDSLTAAGKEYLSHPASWYQFNSKILQYHSRRNIWTEIGQSSSMARAGAVLTGRNGILYSINGELKPGIRTPEINKLILTP